MISIELSDQEPPPPSYDSLQPEPPKSANQTFGVCLSGGGIRSASFCSGVLLRLTELKRDIKYVSCVSGGGYVGNSWIQRLYGMEMQRSKGSAAGGKDNLQQQAATELCQAMRDNIGYLANFRQCFLFGVWDLICILFYVALWLFLAAITMGPIGFVLSAFIDFFVPEAKINYWLLVFFVIAVASWFAKCIFIRSRALEAFHLLYFAAASITLMLISALALYHMNTGLLVACIIVTVLTIFMRMLNGILTQLGVLNLFTIQIVYGIILMLRWRADTPGKEIISGEFYRHLYMISVALLVFLPVTMHWKNSIFHIFYRRRLQDRYKNVTFRQLEKKKGAIPELISNMTINMWYCDEKKETTACLAVSPSGWERLPASSPKSPSAANEPDCTMTKKLKNMTVAESMAISGGAISDVMGARDIARFLPLVGEVLGKWVICFRWFLLVEFIFNFIMCAALGWGAYKDTFDPRDPFDKVSKFREGRGGITAAGVAALYVLICFVFMCFDRLRPYLWSAPLFRSLAASLRIPQGPSTKPPSCLYLSDGGHFDNTGLLALLEKKDITDIVIADGTEDETRAGEDLFAVLEMARRFYKFSVLHQGKSNVLDMRTEFLHHFMEIDNAQVFKFYLFRQEGEEPPRKINVTYCRPIKPPRFFNETDDIYEDREGVTDIPGLCCVCCHSYCKCIRCGRFPYHFTAHQFFTSVLFDAYHDQGQSAVDSAMLNV